MNVHEQSVTLRLEGRSVNRDHHRAVVDAGTTGSTLFMRMRGMGFEPTNPFGSGS